MADNEIVIRNPSRRIVPIGIAACIVVMFVPPLVLSAVHSAEALKAIVGAIAMLLLAGWFLHSARNAPVEMRVSQDAVTVRSVKESHYALSQIRRWFFAVPRGLPTQSAPDTNALLVLQLEDGVRFRGEVTAQEAAVLARRLPHVAMTNAITD